MPLFPPKKRHTSNICVQSYKYPHVFGKEDLVKMFHVEDDSENGSQEERPYQVLEAPIYNLNFSNLI